MSSTDLLAVSIVLLAIISIVHTIQYTMEIRHLKKRVTWLESRPDNAAARVVQGSKRHV